MALNYFLHRLACRIALLNQLHNYHNHLNHSHHLHDLSVSDGLSTLTFTEKSVSTSVNQYITVDCRIFQILVSLLNHFTLHNYRYVSFIYHI